MVCFYTGVGDTKRETTQIPGIFTYIFLILEKKFKETQITYFVFNIPGDFFESNDLLSNSYAWLISNYKLEVTKIHEVKLQRYRHVRGIRWDSSNTDGDSLEI